MLAQTPLELAAYRTVGSKHRSEPSLSRITFDCSWDQYLISQVNCQVLLYTCPSRRLVELSRAWPAAGKTRGHDRSRDVDSEHRPVRPVGAVQPFHYRVAGRVGRPRFPAVAGGGPPTPIARIMDGRRRLSSTCASIGEGGLRHTAGRSLRRDRIAVFETRVSRGQKRQSFPGSPGPSALARGARGQRPRWPGRRASPLTGRAIRDTRRTAEKRGVARREHGKRKPILRRPRFNATCTDGAKQDVRHFRFDRQRTRRGTIDRGRRPVAEPRPPQHEGFHVRRQVLLRSRRPGAGDDYFDGYDPTQLRGNSGIVHTRYATSGRTTEEFLWRNIQPVFSDHPGMATPRQTSRESASSSESPHGVERRWRLARNGPPARCHG